MKKAAAFIGIGFELIALVWFSSIAGEVLDKKMGWNGDGTTYSVVIAFILWFIHMIVMARSVMKDEDDAEPQ